MCNPAFGCPRTNMRRGVLRVSLEANQILAQMKIATDDDADIRHRRGVQVWNLVFSVGFDFSVSAPAAAIWTAVLLVSELWSRIFERFFVKAMRKKHLSWYVRLTCAGTWAACIRKRCSSQGSCSLLDQGREVSDAEIMKAMEAVGLADWVRSLPNGLDTHLITGEQMVAGGLLRDSPLVRLDECTSALDLAFRSSMTARLRIILQGKTSVVLTHHEDMLAICDRVVHLNASVQSTRVC